ncbi:LysR family transcriptional regulator [Sphingomonas antarctica]|uniref:LysR substrate-binding domain-containing protein n=1 Tax=Sphingomonas antarctica TaxID=2040274 RepID=UPI0039E9746C
MRRLPSLSGIEAFVAVSRAGSLKTAADELALSSPALSRRIQSLERSVGKPLFNRGHQSITLNKNGERLLALIAPALDQMTDAIDAMASDHEVSRLRLGVLPLFAAQQLMPRMGELRAAHPELHLDLDTAPYASSRLGDGLDAAIVLTRDPDPALHARRLDRNKVFAIAAKHYRSGPGAITKPDDLKDLTVILHRDMPDTFSEWRNAVGRPDLEPRAIDHYDSGQLMLDAAAQGLGVAFMHASHFSEAHDERLAPLFDVEVESPYSYWFVCKPRALEQRPVRVFHDWLTAKMAA